MNKHESDKNSKLKVLKSNFIYFDAFLNQTDPDKIYKIELTIVNDNGTKIEKEVFNTKNKIENFIFFTIYDKEDNSFIYFLICLNNYDKFLFFGVNFSELNSSDKLDLKQVCFEHLTFCVLPSTHPIMTNHISLNKNNFKLTKEVKIKFCSHYLNNDKEKFFIFSALIFQNFVTLIKIKIVPSTGLNFSKNITTDGYLNLKNFRYSGFIIYKLLFNSLQKDFTGDNYELITSIFYDKTNKDLLNFQKILLPNLENEMIMNYNILSIKLDHIDRIFNICKFSKISSDNSIIYYVFYFYEGSFRIIFFNHEDFSLISELEIQFENLNCDSDEVYVDYIKIINNPIKYCGFLAFLILNNQYIAIYEIDPNLKYIKQKPKFPILFKTKHKHSNYFCEKFKIFHKNDKFYISYLIPSLKSIMIYSINTNLERLDILTEYEIELPTKSLYSSREIKSSREIPLNEMNLYVNFQDQTKPFKTVSENLIINNYNKNFTEIIKTSSNLINPDSEIKISKNFLLADSNLELVSLLSGGFIILNTKDNLFILDSTKNNLKSKFTHNLTDGILDVYEKILTSKILLIFKKKFVIYDKKKDKIELEEIFEDKDKLILSVKNDEENCLYLIFSDKIVIYSLTKLKKTIKKKEIFKVDSLKSKFKNKVLAITNDKIKIFEFFIFVNSDVSVIRQELREVLNHDIKKILLMEDLFFCVVSNLIYIFEYKSNDKFTFNFYKIIQIDEYLTYELEFLKITKSEFDNLYLSFSEGEEKIMKYLYDFDLSKDCVKVYNFSSSAEIYKISKNSEIIFSCSSKKNNDNIINFKIWKNIDKNLFYINHSLFWCDYGLIEKIRNSNSNSSQDSSSCFVMISYLNRNFSNTLQLICYSHLTLKLQKLIEIKLEKESHLKFIDSNFFWNKLSDHIIIFLIFFDELKESRNLVLLKLENLKRLKRKYLLQGKNFEKNIKFDLKNEEKIDFSITTKSMINSNDIETNIESEYFLDKIKIIEDLDKNIFYTNIEVINEKNILILNSNYGNLLFSQFDDYCNFNKLYEFSYSSHLIELSSLKNDYSNKEDLLNLLQKDEELNFVEKYELLNKIFIELRNESQYKDSCDKALHNSFKRFVLLFYNFGILIYNIQIDLLTNFTQINFFQQMSFDNLIQKVNLKYNKVNLNEKNCEIFIETENKIIKIGYKNNKFHI